MKIKYLQIALHEVVLNFFFLNDLLDYKMGVPANLAVIDVSPCNADRIRVRPKKKIFVCCSRGQKLRSVGRLFFPPT